MLSDSATKCSAHCVRALVHVSVVHSDYINLLGDIMNTSTRAVGYAHRVAVTTTVAQGATFIAKHVSHAAGVVGGYVAGFVAGNGYTVAVKAQKQTTKRKARR